MTLPLGQTYYCVTYSLMPFPNSDSDQDDIDYPTRAQSCDLNGIPHGKYTRCFLHAEPRIKTMLPEFAYGLAFTGRLSQLRRGRIDKICKILEQLANAIRAWKACTTLGTLETEPKEYEKKLKFLDAYCQAVLNNLTTYTNRWGIFVHFTKAKAMLRG